jgi:hypothetical protein
MPRQQSQQAGLPRRSPRPHPWARTPGAPSEQPLPLSTRPQVDARGRGGGGAASRRGRAHARAGGAPAHRGEGAAAPSCGTRAARSSSPPPAPRCPLKRGRGPRRQTCWSLPAPPLCPTAPPSTAARGVPVEPRRRHRHAAGAAQRALFVRALLPPAHSGRAGGGGWRPCLPAVRARPCARGRARAQQRSQRRRPGAPLASGAGLAPHWRARPTPAFAGSCLPARLQPLRHTHSRTHTQGWRAAAAACHTHPCPQPPPPPPPSAPVPRVQDTFFKQLRSAPDGWSLMCEYFGRGLLNHTSASQPAGQ